MTRYDDQSSGVALEDQPRDEPTDAHGFLVDWSPDQRTLPDEQRANAGAYIRALVAYEQQMGRLESFEAPARALALWQQFRSTYDNMDGPYNHGFREDALRSMSRI